MDEELDAVLAQVEAMQNEVSGTSEIDRVLGNISAMQRAPVPQPRSFVNDAATSFNAFGQNSIGQLANAIPGVDVPTVEVPNTPGGAAGHLGTLALSMAGPVGFGSTAVKAAPVAATNISSLLRNVVHDIGTSWSRNPALFVAYEGLAGMSAGLGGYVTAQTAPDSAATRFIGEVLGGMAPALVASSPAAAISFVKSSPVGGAIGRQVNRWLGRPSSDINSPVVQNRIDRATDERQIALDRMEEDLLPGLTPAAQTGDEGLLRLEAAVQQRLSDSHQFIDDSYAEVQLNIQRAIAQFETVPPEATAATYRKAQETLSDALDETIRRAALATEQRIANMAPAMGREQANIVASEELRTALASARLEETRLFSLIPEESLAPTVATQAAYAEALEGMTLATRGDMPPMLKRFLNPESQTFFGPVQTIKEMRGLSSSLRAYARNARSGEVTNLNGARIADNVAEAISADIANTTAGPEVADAVKVATNFSKDLNERFRTGAVGDILKNNQQGARVAAGQVLEGSLGAGNPAKARDAFDSIILAAEDSTAVNEAMSSYVLNNFMTRAIKEGQLDRSAAMLYLRNNNELLTRMPAIKQEIEGLVASGDAASFIQRQVGRHFNLKKSKATMFIEGSPDKAFQRVFASTNPVREMRNLSNMAARDTTGNATAGLKSALTDHIVSRISARDGTVTGRGINEFFSGRGVRPAMRSLYTPDEFRRWETIARTASRLDAQSAARPSAEGVLPQGGSFLMRTLAGITGARVGASISRATGGGTIQTPGIVASAFRRIADQGVNPHRILLEDAVQDEALFRMVLAARTNADGSITDPKAMQYLNAWAVGVLARLQDDGTSDVPSTDTIPTQ